MDAIAERCCGLDVHKKKIVACLLVGAADSKARKQCREFGTFTDGLEQLRDWLVSEGCTHVAMESTGSYWFAVYVVLEAAQSLKLVVGNARHMANVPGRKTDMKDAEWIAHLLRHGLIRSSFVPPEPLRDLRDLLRYRRGLVQQRTTEKNRLIKVLETAGIKLASVATQVLGVSGRLMLRSLIEGTASPQQMADMAKGRLRKKTDDLSRALRGRVREHHRVLLEMQLHRVEQADRDIEMLDAEIDRRLEPYRAEHELLKTIPGVDWYVAAVIIAELGVDMAVFPSAKHAAAWTGLAPGNNSSGGKSKSASTRKGNVHLKCALVQAVIAASKRREGYLRDKYFRLASRRGKRRAAVAVAHKILTAAYHMLSTGVVYEDLGPAYLDTLDEHRVCRNAIRRLQGLGYEVELRKRAA